MPLDLRIYRPQTSVGVSPGEWPEGRFPILVFHHGIGQDATQYDHVFRPIVEDGFIVANIDIDPNSNTSFNAQSAANAMACAVRYLTQAWEDSEHVGCGVSLMGHSRGGESAILAIGPILFDGLLEIDTIVAMGGRYNIGVVTPEATRPFLAIASAVDEQVIGDPVTAYDRMGSEMPAGAPKVILRAYDVPHNAFGGVSAMTLSDEQEARSMLTDADYLDKGHAVASSYTRAFLRYHVLERDSEEYADFFSFRRFPEDVVEPSWWDYLDGYDQLSHGLDCSSLSEDECRATQGCVFVDPDCDDVDCLGLSEPACDLTRGCAWDGDDCYNQPVILGAWIDPLLPPEDRAIVDAFEDGQQFIETSLQGSGSFDEWELGEILDLNGGACDPDVGQVMECENEDTRSFFPTGHATNGLRLYGDGVSDGHVRWSLEGLPNHEVGPLDSTGFTHARMRVGVRSRLVGNPFNTPENCDIAETAPWSLAVQLTSMGDATRTVNVRPLVQQDAVWSVVQGIGPATETCAADFFMQTIEVSFAEFANGLGTGTFTPEALTSLEVQLPAANGPGEIILDTIELVREPNAFMSSYTVRSGTFGCEAAEDLVVTLTTCTEEPQSGLCPTLAIVDTPLDPPEVPSEWGGPFDGFVVHGWAEDVEDPTDAELDEIAASCVVACEQYYADDPHVSATCSASGAFETPTLLSETSTPSIPRIPTEHEDGDGIWYEPHALTCNLESDCCDAFAEDVCRAAPSRPTPAQLPLGTGQKWLIELEGTLTVMSLDDEDPQSVSVVGSMGSSTCTEGNAEDPCPFYLGSLHIEQVQSLGVEIDCDGTPIELPLDALEVDLVQPAMGIDIEGNYWKGFPPGALHLRTHLDVGPFAFEHVEANQEKVFVLTSGEWMSAGPANGVEFYFDVPCNGQREPMKAWFELMESTTIGTPPAASIDMPSSVTCGTTVDLDVDASDVENDIASIRWELDGVLLDGSLDEIEVNAPHQVRVVVRDARGATTVDAHVIDCTPP